MPTVKKYDKYGDPIVEKVTEINPQRKKAFAVTMIIQIVMILLDVVFFITSLNYCCFILLPVYIFIFIAYTKAVHSLKDDGLPTKKYNIFKFASIGLFVAMTALCTIAIAMP